MSATESIDGGDLSDNVICPRCSTALLPHAIFCGSCGERIKRQKTEEGKTRTENDDDDAHEQEVNDTESIPALSQAHLKRWQSYQSLKHNELTEQTYKSSSLPQDVGVLTVEKLAASSMPVHDSDTKKHGAAPLAKHLGQQIIRLLSIVDAASQQIAGTLGSNSGSTMGDSTLMESAKDDVGMKLASDEASEFPVVSSNNSAVTEPKSETWGWLPVLSLTSGVGVFLVALAGYAGRVASQWADPLFWLGLLVLLLPIALRLLSPKPARRERIALLVVLGSALYLFRDLDYPLSFAYNDEFLFWRGTQDIAMSGHLFRANPLLPIGPFYPGLEILTNALSSLTGLSIFVSGMIVIEVAGLVLVLSLYLFFEYLSSSARMAGIATLLYMANIFQFGATTFHYQSLAMPLAAFVLFATLRRACAPTGYRLGLTVAIWLGLAAVVITHHVTSYALVAILLLLTAVFLLPRLVPSFHHIRDQKDWVGPGGAALVGLVMCVLWLHFTANSALDHLTPYLDNTVRQLIQILNSERAPRQLFYDGSGYAEPLWERVTSFSAVVLISLGLPFGLFQIWRRYRSNAFALALAVGVLAYPISLLLRLTVAGIEISGRAQAYLFIMVAFVLSAGITHFWSSRVPNWRYSALVVGAMVIIFIGGWINGTAPLWLRLPGPYMVSADPRSIGPESVASAEWARSHLGPGQRMVSDRINSVLMATYGYERVVTSEGDKILVSSIFLSPHFDAGVETTLRRGRVQYIVVDRRLSTALPRIGFYYDVEEPHLLHYSKPIDPAALAKFDGVQNVSRVFDSGDIVIYDVEVVTSGPSTAPASPSYCTPAPPTAVSGSYPKIARLYTGTIDDIPTGLKTNISLTGIQQQQGSICGYLSGIPPNTVSSGMPANGPFKGSITIAKQIQFTLTSDTGQVTYSFDGVIQPDGTVAGTYCSLGVGAGQCSDYGLWTVSLAT